jgi:hypothetical protein
LQAKNISLSNLYGKKNLDKSISQLKLYLKQGGFSETIIVYEKIAHCVIFSPKEGRVTLR